MINTFFAGICLISFIVLAIIVLANILLGLTARLEQYSTCPRPAIIVTNVSISIVYIGTLVRIIKPIYMFFLGV